MTSPYRWGRVMTEVLAELHGNTGQATVLVVEDEVLVRSLIADVLREEGYLVIEAVNADEAVAVLRSPVRIDLVLTDMTMPGSMNGAGLVRMLRAELPFVKVLMAASVDGEISVRPLLDGFLAKPFIPSQLTQFVRAQISPQREEDGE